MTLSKYLRALFPLWEARPTHSLVGRASRRGRANFELLVVESWALACYAAMFIGAK